MTTYKAGVEFGTNVGVLSRDMATAAQVTKVFGTEAATSLKQATVAQDQYVLAAQKVEAADARLAASKERLIALQAAGTASTREMSAAQSAFVVSQERLLAAQTAQAKIARDAAVVSAGPAASGHVGIGGLAAGLAATTVALKIKDAVEEGARSAASLQAINRQVDVSLESTGNVANTSAEHIDKVGESVAHYSGISDKAVVAGQLLELTFTGIRNEGDGANAIFDRGAKVAADMAIGLHLARGGAIDYQGAMQLLARALNDPIAGMVQLRRAGVSFTADQRAQITELAKSGHMLEAQGLILDLVSQKYGDAAKQFGATAEGAFAQGRVALDEFERALASPVLAGGIPILHALTDTMRFLTDHPVSLEIGELSVGVVGAAFAFASLERAMRFLRESEWLTALGKWLFGYRTVGRAITTLAAEEDAQALSSVRAAEAQGALAASYERTAAAAGAAAEAETAAGVAGEVATAGAAASGLSGLLARVASSPGLGIRAGSLAAGATVAAGLIDPVILASMFAGGGGDPKGLDQAQSQQNNLAGQFVKKGGGFYAGGFEVTDPQTEAALTLLGGQIKGGSYLNDPQLRAFAQAHPDLYNYNAGGQAKTTVAQNKLLASVLALAATTAVQGTAGLPNVSTDQLSSERSLIGGTLPGLTDAPSTVRADHLAALGTADRAVTAAQRRYAAAQRAVSSAGRGVDPNLVTAAQDRLTASEDRLLQIRFKHGTTAAQIASAEASIATARARLNALNDTGTAGTNRLASAEDRLKTAHDGLLTAQGRQVKAARDAHAGGALSAAQVGARFAQNLKHAQDLDTAQRSLADQGVSQGVIEQLDALEKQAPGTLQRVAKSLTPAMVKALNSEYAAMQKTQQDFLVIPFQAAALYAAKEHEREIRALAESDRAAFDKYLPWGSGRQMPPVHSNAGTIGHPVGENGQPIGVRAGTTRGVVGPNVVVNVHTSAPITTRNTTNVNVAGNIDTKTYAAIQRRARYAKAVAG